MEVLKDANLDGAARAAVSGSMTHCGQLCISTERLIVQKEIAEELIGKIKSIASNIHSSSTPNAKLGPVFSTSSAANIINLVKDAVDGGAKLIVGDLKHEGAYVQPHVVVGAKPGDGLWDKETFGPVLTIAIAESVEHAIELANASTYTLSSAIWTNDMRLAFDVASKIRTGAVLSFSLPLFGLVFFMWSLLFRRCRQDDCEWIVLWYRDET